MSKDESQMNKLKSLKLVNLQPIKFEGKKQEIRFENEIIK